MSALWKVGRLLLVYSDKPRIEDAASNFAFGLSPDSRKLGKISALFDHLIGACEQSWRDNKPNVSRHLSSDRELEGGRLTEWHFCWISTFEYLSHVISDLAECIKQVTVMVIAKLRETASRGHSSKTQQHTENRCNNRERENTPCP